MIISGSFTGSSRWGIATSSSMILIYNTTLSPTTEIQLPLYGATNVVVNWGDGNTETFTTSGDKSHTYATNGTYTVTITGSLEGYGNFVTNATSLIACTSFGNLGMTDIGLAFANCTNLTTVPSSLPSTIQYLYGTFQGCTNFNDSNIVGWDTTNVIDMNEMFYNATTFNQPIGSWNTSNVTNMYSMFSQASNFNQSLNSWNTANVTDMSYMFYKAVNFNGSIGNWNTANVTDMSYMFYENLTAMAFNQPIGSWNVSSVTNMEEMFRGCESFNQPLNSWNVGSVTNMISMFEGAITFNQPLSNWNVSLVTSMSQMFAVAIAFNQDISAWNVSSVTSMSNMFSSAENFNQPLNNWNVSNVTDMHSMFSDTYEFNQPLNNWNVSNVTNMIGMFTNASSFNQNISNWCVTNILSEPTIFSIGSPLTAPNKPVWGTCPGLDPDYTSVELLMHFDGANGGSTFTDNSPSPKTFTLSGTPITSTTTFQFGTASGYFNGSSWLQLGTNILLTGNYTIEGWAHTSLNFFQVSNNGNEVTIIGNGGAGGFLGSSIPNNSNNYINVSGTPTNTWYYWAVVQSGNLMTVYINGIASGNSSTPSGLNFSVKDIGRYDSPYGSYNFTGYLDELRITQGIARYTANFTPPSAPFPNS